jgi:hypothetical protein
MHLLQFLSVDGLNTEDESVDEETCLRMQETLRSPNDFSFIVMINTYFAIQFVGMPGPGRDTATPSGNRQTRAGGPATCESLA